MACPFPLVIPDNPNATTIVVNNYDTGCALNCDNVMYSENEWEGIKDIVFIFACVSFFGSAFVFLTWYINQKKRAKQSRIMHLSFCTGMVSLSFLLIFMVGWEETVCEDNITPSNEGLCVFQGWLLATFALATAFWWFFIAFNTYASMIGSKTMKMYDSLDRPIFLISYGVPALNATIAVAGGQVYYAKNNIACFISDSDNHAWEATLFFVPLTVLIMSGVALLLRIVVFVLSHIRDTRASLSDSSRRAFTETIVRLFVFLGLYMVLLSIILAFKINSDVKEDEYTDAVSAFVGCRLYQMLTGQSLDACGEHVDPRVSITFTEAFAFSTAGVGIGVMAVYGTKIQHIKTWRRFGTHLGHAVSTQTKSMKDTTKSVVDRVRRGGSERSEGNSENEILDSNATSSSTSVQNPMARDWNKNNRL